MRKLAFAIALLFLGGGATHAESATPQSSTPNPAWVADPATITHIRSIVANTEGTDGVFVVGDDGSIRHVQSGLLCPPKFPNVDFWHAEIFSSPQDKGADVGCDYGRNGGDGHAVSKLTIFATRAPDGMTLDQAFQNDRAEVLQAAPDAKSEGDAINVKNDDNSANFPDLRSEEFLEVRGSREYTTQLLVSAKNGWVFEIRTTFEGSGNHIVIPEGGTVHDAVLAAGDRLMLSAAYVRLAGAGKK